jgi:hypothetical protein
VICDRLEEGTTSEGARATDQHGQLNAKYAQVNPVSQIFGSRRANRTIDSPVDEALVLTGTSAISDGTVPLTQSE